MIHVKAKVETCTGHRLMGYSGKCSHPHGHNYLWTAMLQKQDLDSIGMALDFSVLKRHLREVTDMFDHAMVLRQDDPLVEFLMAAGNKLVVLDQNPTSENLGTLVQQLLAQRIGVRQNGVTVVVQETLLTEVVISDRNILVAVPRVLEVRP